MTGWTGNTEVRPFGWLEEHCKELPCWAGHSVITASLSYFLLHSYCSKEHYLPNSLHSNFHFCICSLGNLMLYSWLATEVRMRHWGKCLKVHSFLGLTLKMGNEGQERRTNKVLFFHPYIRHSIVWFFPVNLKHTHSSCSHRLLSSSTHCFLSHHTFVSLLTFNYLGLQIKGKKKSGLQCYVL